MTSHLDQAANGSMEPIGATRRGNEIGPPFVNDASESRTTLPEPIEACVHSLFKRVAIERPSSLAISAWDGELTYGHLDLLSSRLAFRLAGLVVKPGTTVVLCFEKTLMAPVAVLGVAKAGGASIFLDITQPQGHLQTVIARVPHSVLLSSPDSSHLARQLATCDVTVLDNMLAAPDSSHSSPLPSSPVVRPSDTLNILLMPSDRQSAVDVAITHRSMSTAIFYQQKALGYTTDSRVFDVAPQGSYLAWCTLLHTLTSGGCLIIPSEDDRRQRFRGSATALQANAAHLTPQMIPELDHTVFAGRMRLTYVGEL